MVGTHDPLITTVPVMQYDTLDHMASSDICRPERKMIRSFPFIEQVYYFNDSIALIYLFIAID